MTAEEVLRASERSALGNNQIVTNVTGKVQMETRGKKWKSIGALGFILLALVVAGVFFSSGSLIPAAISDRLIEETDVQYADAVESKKLVFQQAMKAGELPENTVAVLQQYGVETEKADNGEVVLVVDGQRVTADEFVEAVSTNTKLYNAFDQATYSRAAYYYDDAAKKAFREMGTTRNNYTADSDFDKVMDEVMGRGSNVSVNSVAAVKKESEGESYVEYEAVGTAARSGGSAAGFINEVGSKNTAATSTEATLNSADTLKVADTMSKEQRSELFFLTFMENISKMKAGEGNESKINEAMNYLYEAQETEVVDVKTGEVVKVKGTALESPSLYAVLAGSKVDTAAVENYSSDRVLKTVENRVGAASSSAITGTVASTSSGVKGSIGRLLGGGEEGASAEALSSVDQTINASLVDNSYSTIKGVGAGEFLVEGAVNVGKRLAQKSGGTAGDAAAVSKYARLTSSVLAMDAAADRMNRSPFDVSSKNTFLGALIRKLAVIGAGESKGMMLMSGVKNFAGVVGKSMAALIPGGYADEASGYLTDFGDCTTYATIGAVGTAQCSEVATFDTSTLRDTFNDAGFVAFVEANTTLGASGKRTINKNSVLADFILYNNERVTPLGVTDGGILESLGQDASSVGFVSDILGMVRSFLGASDADKRIASGAAYVNSAANPDWQTYKYAQRYVSLARATESLQQYAGGSTAYNNIYGFEGDENPVIAFTNEYHRTAQR